MSFVNLMASDVWSDADITSRTEAMLRAQWSVQAQTILSRKAVGVALGQFTLSPDEQIELGRFANAGLAARVAGEEARADMALLRQALEAERCYAILALPVTEPELGEEGEVTNQTELDLDEQNRTSAQQGIDKAGPEALALVEQRKEISE